MLIAIAIFALIIVIALVFEYRFRKPDELVLYESNNKIIQRKSRFYPRHFSLALQNTTHSFQLNVDAAAKGNLDIKIKLSVTVAAAIGNIPALIRVGGWNSNAVIGSAKELEIIIQSIIKEFAEKYEIEELSSEKIYNYLRPKIDVSKENKNSTVSRIQFGVHIDSMTREEEARQRAESGLAARG